MIETKEVFLKRLGDLAKENAKLKERMRRARALIRACEPEDGGGDALNLIWALELLDLRKAVRK